MLEEQLLPKLESNANQNKGSCSAINCWLTASGTFPNSTLLIGLLFDVMKLMNIILCILLSRDTMYLMIILTAPLVMASLIISIICVYLAFTAIKHQRGTCCALSSSIPLILVGIIAVISMSVGETFILKIPAFSNVQLVTCEDSKGKQKKNAESVPYLKALARYYFVTSSDWKGRYQRLLAINYYLHAVFYARVNNLIVSEDFVEVELDKVYNLQTNGYKDENIITDAISWKDIYMRSPRRNGYRMQKLMHVIYLWSCLQFIVSLLYMIHTQINDSYYTLFIVAGVYGILEIMNYKLAHSVLLKLGFYSCLLLPNWSIVKIRYQRPWRKTLGSVQLMMKGIRRIHYIMFGQYEEIKGLNECIDNENIRSIIAEFAWTHLPSHENIKEFQATCNHQRHSSNLGLVIN